ncbi:MAG: CinA family protein [Clostridia bacterium]|nr:CinA family protein [Clostridia bacterium]
MPSLQLIIQTLAKESVSLCLEKNITFGTAESCTGGLIAASITDVAGASAAFFGGVVSYDNSVKHSLLGVQTETLERFGAVSEETAKEMSSGALRALGVNYAVAVTGIAGPGGGTPTKPVGLVYISVASKNGVVVTENHFSGDREAVRLQTVATALTLLNTEIRKH